MKVLVTGGAGYLGAILVPELLKYDINVTVIDNFYFNQVSLLSCSSNRNFNIINGDVRDKHVIKNAIRDVDYIIPLAALVGRDLCINKEKDVLPINVESIKIIMQAKGEYQKVIFPSTQSCYGIVQDDVLCDEDYRLKPISLYGEAKANAEEVAMQDNDTICFRLGTLFGTSPRMRVDLLINSFVYRALHEKNIVIGKRKKVRNYLHVNDAAKAFVYAIMNWDNMKGEIFNIGHSELNLDESEICKAISRHIKDFEYYQLSEIVSDLRNYAVSMDKISSKGWFAEYSLDDGIKELIKTYSMLKVKMYTN